MRYWKCPICNYVMTEEQSKGYSGCPNGFHFAQHVQTEAEYRRNAEANGWKLIEVQTSLEIILIPEIILNKNG